MVEVAKKHKFGLLVTILICVNTILGGGAFINARNLSVAAGPLGFVGYIASLFLALPLVLTIAELAKLYPVNGGLYVYSKKHLGPKFGFIGGWAYFLSKTTSAGLLFHVVLSFFQSQFKPLQAIPTLALDWIALSVLVVLLIVGMNIGGRLQYVFTALKSIPFVFAFFCGAKAFNITNFFNMADNPFRIFAAIPVALYAVIGFGIICAIGGFVENPAKNIKKAIIIAFCVATTIDISFQIVMYGVLGDSLVTTSAPLLLLGKTVFPYIPLLGRIVNGIVFTSILAGAINIFSGNSWNLHMLAQKKHLPFSRAITKVNRFYAPWVSIILEGLLAGLILTITKNQISLQNMTVLSIFISFFLCSIALFKAIKNNEVKTRISFLIPMLSIGTCFYVCFLCFKNIINFGISVSFVSVFLLGCIPTFFKDYLKKKTSLPVE